MTAQNPDPEGRVPCCECCSKALSDDVLRALANDSTTVCPYCGESLRVSMVPGFMR